MVVCNNSKVIIFIKMFLKEFFLNMKIEYNCLVKTNKALQKFFLDYLCNKTNNSLSEMYLVPIQQ